jgi:3-dehydroquinate dehydratase-1
MNLSENAQAHRNFRAFAQDWNASGSCKNGRLVGVIASRAALEIALRLRRVPDFFELRLDALRDCFGEIERTISRLCAPLILTARHPAEGGSGSLTAAKRRILLQRFLPHATFVDVELRSVTDFAPLFSEIRRHKVGLILSRHDLQDTPTDGILREQLNFAVGYQADIFKIVTRTDTSAQLDRLLAFYRENSAAFPIAAMGLGKLGAASRRQLLRLGSALNYAALGQANASGQPTLRQLRRIRNAYII